MMIYLALYIDLSIKIGFLELRALDIVEILLFALFLYQVFKFLRGSLALNILIGYASLGLVYWIVKFLDLQLLSKVLGGLFSAGIIGMFIIFQPEIRRFMLYIGKGSGISRKSFWQRSNFEKITGGQVEDEDEKLISLAISNMSAARIGAIIVFTGTTEKMYLENTGVKLNASISAKLIESVFQKSSPLHDGAMIISNRKIYSAGAVLPVSENPELPSRIGMRHKAGVGISEHLDVIVIIISEDSGQISVASRGRLRQNITTEQLKDNILRGLEGYF